MADETTEANLTEEEPQRSRRNLLKLAGVAAGAGAVALVARPGSASAANGDTITVGGSFTGTSGTQLTMTTASDQATLELIAPDGSWALAAQSTNEADVKLNGTGRLVFFNAAATGNAQPSASITGNGGELAMSTTGVLWAGSNSSGNWHRINAVRVDTSDGAGNPFPPARIVDTRTTAVLAGGHTLNVSAAGVHGIPSDAIGIFGNLTAIPPSGSYPSGGFVTIYPTGVTRPVVSNINMNKGDRILPNFFICGLGTSGDLTVFSTESTNILIDVFGYLQ